MTANFLSIYVASHYEPAIPAGDIYSGLSLPMRGNGIASVWKINQYGKRACGQRAEFA